MTYLLEQTEILGELANILFNSTDEPYDFLIGKYKFIEDFETIGVTVVVELGAERRYLSLPSGMATRSIDTCEKLRALDFKNTGQSWKLLTLTLDSEGRAKTEFTY